MKKKKNEKKRMKGRVSLSDSMQELKHVSALKKNSTYK